MLNPGPRAIELETSREILARLRGIECRAPEHFAEAFVLRKARLG